MHKEHTSSSLLSSKLPQPHEAPTPVSQYTHILVPTCLASTDGPALRLGLEMAATHRARLTLLHVVPAAQLDPSVHWLDAIDRLYCALNRTNGHTAPGDELNSVDLARLQLAKFLQGELPPHLRKGVGLQVASSVGGVAETIAQFTEEADADLVIMSIGQPRWRLSLLPVNVRGLLRLTQKQVILIRRGAPGCQGRPHR